MGKRARPFEICVRAQQLWLSREFHPNSENGGTDRAFAVRQNQSKLTGALYDVSRRLSCNNRAIPPGLEEGIWPWGVCPMCQITI
eukprot:2422398-Pyramimonas_sp.AAC.1